MILAIHGQSGAWDELAIAAVALAVLWVAVKLAGRKASDEADEESTTEGEPTASPIDAVDPVSPPEDVKHRDAAGRPMDKVG